MSPGLRWTAIAVALAVSLAGCSDGGKDPADPATGGGDAGALPMLHGYVFDLALRPLVGATVKVLDTNASITTDDEGFFGFDGLPLEQFLVVVATMDGFTPGSKQVTLVPDSPTRLNFTLEAVPVAVPYSTVDEHELRVECQAGITVSGDNQTLHCGTGATDSDTWDVAVAPDLAGAVIEVYWEPTQSAAESIGARLETLELGQLNLILAETVGTSPLRLSVPQLAAERYYTAGGLMRLTVYAAPNSDETEAGIGASVLVDQPITAYASLFYVAPPDPAYTIGNAA